MRRSDFDYPLPPELIAQHPPAARSDSRLLCLETDIEDARFTDLTERLLPGDLLVFNDTRVIPARLTARKHSGGRAEVLVERILDPQRIRAQVRGGRSLKVGARLRLAECFDAEVLGRDGELFELRCLDPRPAAELLELYGHVPLPPYIDRADEAQDRERYQTVYARHPGAVAAPTAGLHFDQPLLAGLRARGVDLAYLTLHVGAGTFQPLRVDDVRAHRMHPEVASVSGELCRRVEAARARGGRIVAVGTTVVRALESAAVGGTVRPYEGETRLFIYPGYDFKVVDALVTNFHLPESTLLMLVCAFGGQERVMAAYRHAVAARYRFFSYGDAMFVLKQRKELEQKGKLKA
jgi:S-adenosylmethionine:tRNA ribosyltransferase-isomerase